MGPGRKVPSSKRQPAEAPLTEYDQARDKNVLRNNQMLHRLGVRALSSIVNELSGKKKGKALQPQHSEQNEQGLADEVLENAADNCLTITTVMPFGGSKRVMAVEDQNQLARITRQKTRELQSTNEDLDGSTSNTENCPTHPSDQMEICNEEQENVMVHRWSRGRSMGKELERMTQGFNAKIPIHIAEGKRRPEAPMQAAKLASEGGIVLRQHIPILPHWKDYKEDRNKTYLHNYMGKVAGHFAIDTNNKAVKDVCTDLLKGGQRQMRYKLKKLYFDGIPANEVRMTSPLASMTDEQWRDLVAMWSSAKHKEKCMKNKENREKVLFQQKTGSRSFVAHLHALKQDKYKDVEPTSIDLFKDLHCSNKTGFAEPVQKAIDDMEAIMAEPIDEGQEPKSPTQVLSQVLPRSKFLQTAGIVTAAPKRNGKDAVATRVQELELELDAEKQESAALKDKVEAQRDKLEAQEIELVHLKEHVKSSEGQMESLKKAQEEHAVLLRSLLNLSKS